MNIDNVFQSKGFKVFIFLIAILVILLMVFKLGLIVGTRKADFACRWSDSYHRNFGGPKGGFMNEFKDRNFMDASGIFGQIIKIDNSTSTATTEPAVLKIIIRGRDNAEKIILVSGNTSIALTKDNLKPQDLKMDDLVVVIGEPNQQGQIEAKLIRIIPPPTGMENLPPNGRIRLDLMPPQQH
ncbi:MAG: hypothetical protein NTV62_01975 [Candidatus Gribaldobacteria bacterium]|nr:hypothetical protein [Candidatus Gribaldobacteria bacterium]